MSTVFSLSGVKHMKIIARIHNKFTSKFGIPRQSGLENLTESTIVFENGFKSPDAIRGLENYDYIWLLWLFSECEGESEALTVRPPRLGGNTRMGVFATRSPFRPNSIGLSCVKLKEISADGSLIVTGADLMNGTPIIDIKPYLPYVDAHPEASNGFALASKDEVLEVVIPDKIAKKIDAKTL
ncbi:MAG: tRNA (N6-threonylcarbamoyladenosine(37)-N6)-methyltransferase TrmO, partial [Clostridia bacterium]|nr:tRNA (N6-threonylcarbamoyladenosine(37)-N6)-methyltransferase TrmO [Clostridia bacterium]